MCALFLFVRDMKNRLYVEIEVRTNFFGHMHDVTVSYLHDFNVIMCEK